MNDEQIIQLFFTRNEDAIQQTADQYGASLTRLSENILRNREDAQECVNDSKNKAIQKRWIFQLFVPLPFPLRCEKRRGLVLS